MFIDRSLTFIAGLLLCLTCAEMICEGKTYSKKLCKMDQLGEDDQVFVQRSGTDEMVAQYFCNKSNITIGYCDKCFEIQSEYLVLILNNISHSDRFNAFLNIPKTPFLTNFTLDEDVPSTSTTTAVPHETPIPSIKQTDVPSTSTTTAVPDETPIPSIKQTEPLHTTKMPDAPTGEALSTEAKVAIGIIAGLAVVIAVIAVIADIVYARKAGRDGIIASTITSSIIARKFFAREPAEEVGHPIEMEVFLPNHDRV